MDKQHILNEIVRTARENGGQALGRQRFFEATGIKESDCVETAGYDDVAEVCSPHVKLVEDETGDETVQSSLTQGHVYLIKSGRYNKIGRTNYPSRRERELTIQLPEPSETIHIIATDDSSGIESYWHRRFANRRKNGEWFELSSADVKAFRRRRFM